MSGRWTREAPGFTLIEILITIAIIAIIIAVGIPNFGARKPQYERDAFIASMNGLVQSAWQHALVMQAPHRITFSLRDRHAWIEYAREGQKDKKGEPLYVALDNWYGPVAMNWNERFTIKNFYIEGFDEMARSVGRKTTEVYFYVLPEGLTQMVVVNVLDKEGREPDAGGVRIGLVLNPFTAQFEVHDTFQVP